MKRLSYEDLQRHKDTLEKQNTLLSYFLYDTVRDVQPDAYILDKELGFEAKLYRCLAPHEGYILLHELNGAGIPRVHYLNDIDDKWPTQMRIIADRLKVYRQRRWTQEIQKTS